MSIHTAFTFVSNLCEGSPTDTGLIRPGSTGERVIHLQTALIAEGYPIAADGTYGPRTQASVRDFQAANGLEVDGIAGPRTQAALGIGPGGDAAGGPTTAVPGAAPTVPTGSGLPSPSTTIVLASGQPPACTADVIGAAVDTAVAEIAACQSGWAIGRIDRCPAQTVCEDADVFHVTESGWVYDGNVDALCAEDLAAVGMSPYTAGQLGSYCAVADPPAQPPVIRPDSTGDDVRNLQVALVALGYPISADGTYGPRTQAAIRDFQAANGLEVDGIAGPQTRRALGV